MGQVVGWLAKFSAFRGMCARRAPGALRGLHVCRSIAVNLPDVSSSTQQLVLQCARQVEGFFQWVLRQFKEIYTDPLTPTCPRVTAVGRSFLCSDSDELKCTGCVSDAFEGVGCKPCLQPLLTACTHEAPSQTSVPWRGSIRRGGGGGGMEPKSLCTKNGPTRFSQLQISFFRTVVTLVWRGGVQGGVTPSSCGVRPF